MPLLERRRPCAVRRIALAMAVTPMLWTAAAAEDDAVLNERIQRLERLLEVQTDKIDSLEAQLQSNNGAAKVEAVRIRRMIAEIMQDPDFRSQLISPILQAGYNKGFYIRSSDELFELKIRLQTQFRYIGLNRQSDNPNVLGRQRRDDISGFEWEKSRLNFIGHLFSTKLSYFLRFEGDTDGNNNVRVLDFWFDYEYARGHKIRWGQTKPPQAPQFLRDDSVQQFVDRGIVTYAFTLGRSLGIMAHGVFDLGNEARLKYQAGVFNGFNNQADDVRDVDTNLAVSARSVLAWGSKLGNDESDLSFHETPAFELGMHFGFNDDNNDTRGPALIFAVPESVRAGRGGIGNVDPTGTQYFQFGLDWAMKYRGFSLLGEWAVRTVKSEFSRSFFELATLRRDATHIQGGFLQAGYFLIPHKLEAIGRLEGLWDNGGDNIWAYAVGANYYIRGHGLKLTADVTWAPESPVNASIANYGLNDDMVLYRLQVQAAMQ